MRTDLKIFSIYEVPFMYVVLRFVHAVYVLFFLVFISEVCIGGLNLYV